ncbi:MAG: ASPIC/UnbV domain protein [Verrucomicrobiales bacterium]|nr:ASPIC/UnbV domain protein [Verrucomicrobiales bacterium]
MLHYHLNMVRWCFRLLIVNLFLVHSLFGMDWETGKGYRRLAVAIDPKGKTGFTALSPARSGITFTNILHSESALQNRILENGAGVAAADIDHDGWVDLFFASLDGTCALYKNLGGLKFQDITQEAGLSISNQLCTGVVFADVNGDGFADLLINSLGGGTRLYVNDGKGHFTLSNDSGLIRQGGSSSMALADIDGNGTLDLYVANYRTTTSKDSPVNVQLKIENGKVIVPPEHADRFYAVITSEGKGSLIEKGEKDVLYLNDGKGHFTPVSWTDGSFKDANGVALQSPPQDWGLSVMFRDINGDGYPDIYVCNDFDSPDRVWLNDGKGHFTAASPMAVRSSAWASMAVDFADINRDGYDDYFVADMLSPLHSNRMTQRGNFTSVDVSVANYMDKQQVMRNVLALNRGDGTFADIAQYSGLEATEWTWGGIFVDVDLDGFEDLLIANGHPHDMQDSDTLERIRKTASAPMPGKKSKNLNLFPPLESAKMAFRNNHDLTFTEKGAEWGFASTKVTHGMILADLDNDGVPEIIMNNLNSVATIYKNTTAKHRIAFRLKGVTNTAGIGAKLTLEGGPVTQSQQIISGGRYLSSDDPMRYFATGDNTNQLLLKVQWPSGKQTQLQNLIADSIYEVDEVGSFIPAQVNKKIEKPLFEDLSSKLQFIHVDEPYNDFEKQPLLPYKLSELGPGVSWMDFDGDGREDLFITGARGKGAAIYKNLGEGNFQRLGTTSFLGIASDDQLGILCYSLPNRNTRMVVAQNGYETGKKAFLNIVDVWATGVKKLGTIELPFSCVGAMCGADIRGDGNLAIAVFGRAIQGRYPEPSPVLIFTNSERGLTLDQSFSNSIKPLGPITSALFADLDGDGFPELIMANEWGPVQIYKNQNGSLVDQTEQFGLKNQTGLWTSLAVGDFDQDGLLDIVVGNWGLNTEFNRWSKGGTIEMYSGDLNGSGEILPMIGYKPAAVADSFPLAAFDRMIQGVPSLATSITSYHQYSTNTVQSLFPDKIQGLVKRPVQEFRSMVLLNRRNHFESAPLPLEAQLAPMFGIGVADFDGDGNVDIVAAQNLSGTGPETGRYAAGRGLYLRGNGKGQFMPVQANSSGIYAYGDGRGLAVADYDGDGRPDVALGQNNAPLLLFHNKEGIPQASLTIRGVTGNSSGAGGIVITTYRDGKKIAQAITLGSSYLSQSSFKLLITNPGMVETVKVVWPGGKTKSVKPVQPFKELTISIE